MSGDQGRAASLLGVRAAAGVAETGSHRTLFRVQKWDAEQIAWTARKLGLPPRTEPGAAHFEAVKVRPFDIYEHHGSQFITNAGWSMLMNGVAGSAVTKFSTSGPVGRIGGGISATAVAYADTDMNAATGAANRQWELLSANPTITASGATRTLVFAAAFPTTDGNFAWAEFAVDSGTAAGTGASVATFFEHGNASPGTKTASQTWNVTVTITWS